MQTQRCDEHKGGNARGSMRGGRGPLSCSHSDWGGGHFSAKGGSIRQLTARWAEAKLHGSGMTRSLLTQATRSSRPAQPASQPSTRRHQQCGCAPRVCRGSPAPRCCAAPPALPPLCCAARPCSSRRSCSRCSPSSWRCPCCCSPACSAASRAALADLQLGLRTKLTLSALSGPSSWLRCQRHSAEQQGRHRGG